MSLLNRAPEVELTTNSSLRMRLDPLICDISAFVGNLGYVPYSTLEYDQGHIGRLFEQGWVGC